jgi:putative ABC transport system substrate-binding protein
MTAQIINLADYRKAKEAEQVRKVVNDYFATSLNRPGGNVTGVSFLGNALGARQVELLHELVPKATTIAVLVDTNYQGSMSGLTDVEAAPRS